MNDYLFLILYMFKITFMDTIEKNKYVQNYTFEHKYKKQTHLIIYKINYKSSLKKRKSMILCIQTRNNKKIVY